MIKGPNNVCFWHQVLRRECSELFKKTDQLDTLVAQVVRRGLGEPSDGCHQRPEQVALLHKGKIKNTLARRLVIHLFIHSFIPSPHLPSSLPSSLPLSPLFPSFVLFPFLHLFLGQGKQSTILHPKLLGKGLF